MSLNSEEFSITECPACETLSMGEQDRPSSCCDEPLDGVAVDDVEVESPALEELLAMVFGMSQTELDVCLCVMDVGETTTKEIADELGVDRSHVSRHLNHLLELGVLEKQERLLEGGGRVNVYTPASLETVRRNFTVGLFAWFSEATEVLEDLSREKVEAIADLGEDEASMTIFHDPDEESA